jgi:hypothetical protein
MWILASFTTSTNQKILPTYKVMIEVVKGRRCYEEAVIDSTLVIHVTLFSWDRRTTQYKNGT